MLKNVLAPTTTHIEEKAQPSSSDVQRVNILRAKQNCINSSLNKPGGQEDSIGLKDTKTEKRIRESSLEEARTVSLYLIHISSLSFLSLGCF